jgi:hypothetical protein
MKGRQFPKSRFDVLRQEDLRPREPYRRRLFDLALSYLRKSDKWLYADLVEEMKQLATSEGWPYNHTWIEQAIDSARKFREEEKKQAARKFRFQVEKAQDAFLGTYEDNELAQEVKRVVSKLHNKFKWPT